MEMGGSYGGVYGEFQWEVEGRILHVFGPRRLGKLATFENVNAVNSEQAQWSAQAKIDLNLDDLRAVLAERQAALNGDS
ncbi:MAG: hypothetical protein F4Y01_03760 [Gammaproteobacteria bacterium]|nr:hypothetical protein [Gammaproteobacteria bacterium]